MGVMPWQMERFTPHELTELAEWMQQQKKAGS